MADLSFYIDIIKTLEDINAPYVIIGAFAAAAFGSSRVTYDIDIIVELTEHHIVALAKRYPPPRYYADPVQMRDSIRLGIMFNIIDTDQGKKVDLIPLTMNPQYKNVLQKRRRQTFEDAKGNSFQAWCAVPEDIIWGKLMAWHEGHSSKHEQDILAMLIFIYSNADPKVTNKFSEHYINEKVLTLGHETVRFWNKLKKTAKKQLQLSRPNNNNNQ